MKVLYLCYVITLNIIKNQQNSECEVVNHPTEHPNLPPYFVHQMIVRWTLPFSAPVSLLRKKQEVVDRSLHRVKETHPLSLVSVMVVCNR